MEAVVLKTTLDLDECRRLAQDTSSQKNALIKGMVKSAPSDTFQPKKLIDKYRKAAPCSASWDDMSGKGLFKVCHKCTLHVYDFANCEISEAEELVLKRENKKNPVFFRRKDGKFLTTNCPAGVRQQQKLFALGAAVSCLLLMAVTAFLLSPPAPPPHPVVSDGPPPPPLDIMQRRITPVVIKKTPVTAGLAPAKRNKFMDVMMSGYQTMPSSYSMPPAAISPAQFVQTLPGMPPAVNRQPATQPAASASTAGSAASPAQPVQPGSDAQQKASPYVQYYR
jgi:hypothetical protein